MLTRTIIKYAAPLPKIESFKRFLFIGPHPDDIEIGAGATAAKLIKEGKEVYFLICTDGRFGNGHLKDKTYDEVALIRKKETIESAKFLGLKEENVFFLNLSDGGFYEYDDLVKGIAKLCGEINPDVIFAPDHKSTSECHKDHLNVGEAASQIACFGPYEGIMNNYGANKADIKAIAFYMTAHPNQYIKTTGYLNIQNKAVTDYHKSQFQGKEFDSIRLYLKLRSIEFGIKSLHLSAEGFRVLGPTHMHCLPERGF
ncbi:MAG: PIG-L family deacetylase [Erysipelotrichaceae bacterium]|nr:PIG-L family deacetylase [Erysipelotrichaceae bacterium]